MGANFENKPKRNDRRTLMTTLSVIEKYNRGITVTWEDLFWEFKRRYPRLGKHAIRYKARDMSEIEIFYPNGMSLIYNGWHNKVSGDWTEIQKEYVKGK